MLRQNLIVLALVFCTYLPAQAQVAIPENPQWVPVVDSVYNQEVSRHVLTDSPITAVAVHEGTTYVGGRRGIQRLSGDKLAATSGVRSPITRLRVVHGSLWAMGPKGLWRLDNGEWNRLSTKPFVDVAPHLGQTIAASPEFVHSVNGEELEALHGTATSSPIRGVQSYSESIYVRHANQVGYLQGNRIQYNIKDWGQLPLGAQTRDMLTLGSRVLVPTDLGLAELRGMSWRTIEGADGLPYEDTTCVASGFTNDYWVGTTRGAARFVNGKFIFYGHARWIPHDKVNAIATSNDTAYIATDGGLGIITFEHFTLQKKMAYYKQQLRKRGQLRLGLVNSLRREPDGTYIHNLGDNDVGWTCHYLNALCFEYAVTKDPQVREEAVHVFKTIKWTEEITPILGFPARAIHGVGETATLSKTGSAGRPAEWNLTEDGLWEWKGDTSSDEIVNHVYTVSLFHDLVAQGIEKRKAIEHLDRVIGHIVDRGWVLRDMDGEPTVWAQWHRDFIYSPEHTDERGLNSLQALSFVAVANALFPAEKYAAGKQQLIDWGYLRNVTRQKKTFPGYTRFDDRLAFLAYYPLLRYETDPAVRAAAMRSLERSWEIKRIEKQTWYNYLYGALTGNDCGNVEAVQHLRDYPLDSLKYTYTNSHRTDLQNPRDYRNYLEDWKPLTPRDVGHQRWNRSFQQLDSDGTLGAQDPSGVIEAYWMGRYYGMILPPTATNPAVLDPGDRDHGIDPPPYNGPARPEIF